MIEAVQLRGLEPPLPQGTEKARAEEPPRKQKEKAQDSLELSPEAQREVEALKKADAEVRAHEAAHLAAAGGLARGGASYTYKVGPDGKRYAVAGEVRLDTSPVPGDPEATLAKAQRLRAAALAPGNPSPQDRAVAAAASAMAARASAEARGKGMDLLA